MIMSPEKIVALVPFGEGEGERAPVLDVDRIGLDIGALVGPEAGRDIADVAGDAGDRNGLAARLGLDLLQIEHGGERMAAHPDQRAAAGHRPLRGMRRMRAGMARSEEHTSELQSRPHLVCRLLLEKKKKKIIKKQKQKKKKTKTKKKKKKKKK